MLLVAAWGINFFTRTLAWTLRWHWDDASGLVIDPNSDGDQLCILAGWHNRLALGPALYRRHFQKRSPRRRMAALVSASKDGGVLATAMELQGVLPIRGSSSRRGAQALRELVTAARQGCDLVLTPDGPRGPRYVVQEGVIAAAQLTGLPIIPTAYTLRWKWTLNTWDRFQVPLPFSHCTVHFGPPIRVPRECSLEERESLRQLLEAEIVRISGE